MIRMIPILLLAFKIWMAVDAARKHQPYYWFLIIFFVPFGDLVYFISIKIDDFRFSRLSRFFTRPPSLESLRYQARISPSINNRLALAAGLRDRGLMGEAAEEYTKILDSYPQETDALLYLSFCCIALNQKEEALNVLERLMAVNPSYLDCIGWRTYIRLQKETGRLQESLASLRDLARRHPRAEHQLLLAESLIEADEAIAARGILTTIIEYDAHAPAFSRRANRTFISRARRLLSDLA